ncbi:MAG: methyltransferase domain-containing protein [Candidatus Pacebacteria bacterium]|nr:methyltransferase domain-containing protein [Candidatus Paceibacterota bacterium]
MNKFFDTVKSTLRGQSIYRIMSQQALREESPVLTGRVIDLAGGGKNNYFDYLNLRNASYSSADIKDRNDVDIVLDLTKPLPLGSNSFDAALLFNCLYIFENPTLVLKEAGRIVKPGGFLLLITPFVFNESPEPADYWRFTGQGLVKVASEAGFKDIETVSFGERFTAAVYLLNKFLLLNFLRPLFYFPAMFLDKAVPVGVKKNHPCPLGYLTIIRK